MHHCKHLNQLKSVFRYFSLRIVFSSELMDTRKSPLSQFIFQRKKHGTRSGLYTGWGQTWIFLILLPYWFTALFCEDWGSLGERGAFWVMVTGRWLLISRTSLDKTISVLHAKYQLPQGPGGRRRRYTAYSCSEIRACIFGVSGQLGPAMLCSGVCWQYRRMVRRSHLPWWTSSLLLVCPAQNGWACHVQQIRRRYCTPVSLRVIHFAASFRRWSSLGRSRWTVPVEKEGRALTFCVQMCASSFTSLAIAATLFLFEAIFGH